MVWIDLCHCSSCFQKEFCKTYSENSPVPNKLSNKLMSTCCLLSQVNPSGPLTLQPGCPIQQPWQVSILPTAWVLPWARSPPPAPPSPAPSQKLRVRHLLFTLLQMILHTALISLRHHYACLYVGYILACNSSHNVCVTDTNDTNHAVCWESSVNFLNAITQVLPGKWKNGWKNPIDNALTTILNCNILCSCCNDEKC